MRAATAAECILLRFGDAAHVMYPVGSNGASQAIVDARVLGAAIVEHGVSPAALQAYNNKLCADISALVLAAEREAFTARYKAAAGFAIETLNAAPQTIAAGARCRL